MEKGSVRSNGPDLPRSHHREHIYNRVRQNAILLQRFCGPSRNEAACHPSETIVFGWAGYKLYKRTALGESLLVTMRDARTLMQWKVCRYAKYLEMAKLLSWFSPYCKL